MDDAQKKEQADDLRKNIAQAVELERLKNETAEKKIKLDAHRVNVALARQEQDLKDLKAIQEADYSKLTDEQIENLQKDQADYFAAAKELMIFIDSEFDGVVPFFRKNLILIGAKTGGGKSTVSANIIYPLLKQKNPITGKRFKCLVLTNEENPGDVYGRVISLANGWAYINHEKFTPEQTKTYENGIKALAKGGNLTVLSDSHDGTSGLTTTPEGIKSIFDNLIKNNTHYDCIILDYFQNVRESKVDPSLDIYKCQAKLCEILDQYKNLLPAPIVVLAQMDVATESDPKPAELRFQGRKLITTKATCILEMIIDRENSTTKFAIHKNRFGNWAGQTITVGFDHGKYVKYDDNFLSEVQKRKDLRETQNFNKILGQQTKTALEVKGDSDGSE